MERWRVLAQRAMGEQLRACEPAQYEWKLSQDELNRAVNGFLALEHALTDICTDFSSLLTKDEMNDYLTARRLLVDEVTRIEAG